VNYSSNQIHKNPYDNFINHTFVEDKKYEIDRQLEVKILNDDINLQKSVQESNLNITKRNESISI